VRIPVIFLLLCVLCLTACDDKVVLEENTQIPQAIWSSENPVSYSFDVEDTVTFHNMYINVRNGSDYAYSNLFVFIEIHFPNGKKSVDTLECFLADPSGQWYGRGFGSIYDNRFLYKERKAFPLAGDYTVVINQAMRDESLEEIYDVGFRLARSR
jgi:gliding motility-associated lipoprotein GldH